MDVSAATLLPPTSSSSLQAETITTRRAESGPKEFVSFGYGGGGHFSFVYGPTTGSAAALPDPLAGSTGPVFPHRQDKHLRSSKPRQEVTRYSKEELLGYKEEWTVLPAELASQCIPSLQPERALEPELRNGRVRTPERGDRARERDPYRERPGPKENRDGVERERGPQNDRQCGARSAGRGDESEKEKVCKTVEGILNKLTPEEYAVLLEQLVQAGITSADFLQEVISLVFDRVVLEPTLCPMYAELCVDLCFAHPEFPASEPGEKPVTFRRVLLNKCQSEFEGADALRAEIRQMTGPDQELARAEKERNVKLRTLGNVKFIGELFKQEMIPKMVVHACILLLFGQDREVTPPEENVEALCLLLNAVGRELDKSARFTKVVDIYFQRLRTLDHNTHLPSRIRFMVRDILDVRANKWVPRREEVRARTPQRDPRRSGTEAWPSSRCC